MPLRRARTIVGLIALLVFAAPTPAVAASPSPPAAEGCSATVQVAQHWADGFQLTVTITNTGTTPMHDWYIAWMVPLGAVLWQAWNGMPMQGGPSAMVHAPSWHATLAPGATLTAGLLVTGADPTIDHITCG